ncbi:MAG: LytR C-terminal domain-containing protein [Endomicrobium sp.]|nr:LytR C-terminal domain-containing protein [Endomicrobium sp.]
MSSEMSTETQSKMSAKTKKRLKIAAVVFTVLAVASASLYFSVLRGMLGHDPVVRSILDNQPIRFSVLLYGDEKMNPGELDIFLVTYERRNNVFKVLSINPDMVVFRKKTKALSFKHSFNETAKTDLSLAATNLYMDLFELTENGFKVDFYVESTYSAFLEFLGGDEELKEHILKRDFESRDEQLLNQIEITDFFLSCIEENSLSFILQRNKKLKLVDTNISKFAYIRMLLFNKKNSPVLIFCDLPAKYTASRVEPDKRNITNFLYSVYYKDTDFEIRDKKTIVEVKNASELPRMAEKAAWVLRNNRFDVIEWSNSPLRYNTTLIKDYKGYYDEDLKAMEALNCGKILISYNEKSYYDMTVFIGADCEIYDKLDKVDSL